MSDVQRIRWTDWAVLAGVLLTIAGAIDALMGLTTVLLSSTSDWVGAGTGRLLPDAAGWGWEHLIIGLVLIVVGVLVSRGATPARAMIST